jgi:hypothetical protein
MTAVQPHRATLTVASRELKPEALARASLGTIRETLRPARQRTYRAAQA